MRACCAQHYYRLLILSYSLHISSPSPSRSSCACAWDSACDWDRPAAGGQRGAELALRDAAELALAFEPDAGAGAPLPVTAPRVGSGRGQRSRSRRIRRDLTARCFDIVVSIQELVVLLATDADIRISIRIRYLLCYYNRALIDWLICANACRRRRRWRSSTCSPRTACCTSAHSRLPHYSSRSASARASCSQPRSTLSRTASSPSRAPLLYALHMIILCKDKN